MKHTLKDLTDKDIEAALSSPNVTPNHKLDLTAEVLRRAAQADCSGSHADDRSRSDGRGRTGKSDAGMLPDASKCDQTKI